MTRRKIPSKANGHAEPHDRSNGHAPASTVRDGIPVDGNSAASDDAGGASVAIAASSTAADADHQACTGAALPRPNGPPPESAGEKSHSTNKTKQVPPGEGPLPATIDEFVDEIHSRVDLFEVWQRLLRAEDEKIRQRAVERLTDLRYKTGSSQGEEPQQIIFDLPRPKRD